MSRPASTQISKMVAIVIGACACLAALFAWHLPSDARSLGADVRLIATPPGELEIKPFGAVLATRNLEPGASPIHSSFAIRNVAGKPLSVQLRGLPSSRVLDQELQVSLASGGRTLFSGALGGLRAFTAAGDLRVSARATATVNASVWLAPGSVRYRGQILDVPLDLKATP